MSWTKSGTVSVENGKSVVYGAGTTWASDKITRAGDTFKAPDGRDYELLSVQSNTQLTLTSPYLGTTASGQAYALIHTGLLPAELAVAISDLQSKYLATVAQLYEWETSVAATIPLTNPATQVTTQVKPIAGLIADIALKATAANPSTTGTLTHTGNALVSENIAVSGSLQPWYSGLSVVQLPAAALWTPKAGGVTHLSSNMYFDGSTYKAILDGSATDHYQLVGSYVWRSATGCIAGNEITAWTTGMELDGGGNLLLKSGTGGVGYGVGGTVTQSTSKSTDVTLNKPSGKITMNNAALAAGATVSFRFYNSLIGSTDSFDVAIDGASMTVGHESYLLSRTCWAGGGIITLKNIFSSSLSEAVVLNFNIIKGAVS